MKLINDLLEALKPSEYRQFVKGWDKKKYEDLFKKYATDKKGFRIYIPLKGEPKKVAPDPEVEKAVREAGYEIEDYVTGIASKDDGKRKIKIGKLLKDPKLQQKFANDPKRASAKNVENFVVISRHPYDIAGMSTDRGWKSCMNIHDGCNAHYIPADVKEGSLVAYLVRSDDKNINNPIARVLIKPFINTDEKAEPDKKVALGVEDRVYGSPMSGFRETVMKWVDEVNDSKKLDGVFEFNNNLYNDGGTKSTLGVGPTGKVHELIKNEPMKIGEIDDPSDVLIKLAIDKSSGKALTVLKKQPPSSLILRALRHAYGSRANEIIKKLIDEKWIDDEVDRYLIRSFPLQYTFKKPGVTDDEKIEAIQHIDRYDLEDMVGELQNESDKVWKAILDRKVNLFPKKNDPSNELIEHAVGIDYSMIQYVEDPSRDLLKKLIHNNPSVISYIREHHLDDELVRHVSNDNPRYVRHLKNPRVDEVDRMLDHNATSISHVKNPTHDQLLKVIKKLPDSIDYIKGNVILPLDVQIAYVNLANPIDFRELRKHSPEQKIPRIVMIKALKKIGTRDTNAIGLHDVITHVTDAKILNAIIEADPRNLAYVDVKIPQEIQDALLAKDHKYFKYISHPSQETASKVVANYPEAIKHIEEPSKEVIEAAVAAEPKVINSLIGKKIPTEVMFKVIAKALRADPEVVRYVKRFDFTEDQSKTLGLAAMLASPPNEVEYNFDRFMSMMKWTTYPEKVALAAVKKNPRILLNSIDTKNWTKDLVRTASEHLHDEYQHERVVKMLTHYLNAAQRKEKGFTKEFISELKGHMKTKKEAHKSKITDVKKKYGKIKLQVLKTGTDDPKRAEIAKFIKNHPPIAAYGTSLRYFDGSELNRAKYGLKFFINEVCHPPELGRSPEEDNTPRKDWEFDEAYWRQQQNGFGQIAFYRKGHPVGYFDLHSGKAFYEKRPEYKAHRPSKLEVTESRKSFKQALQESFNDEAQ